MGKLVEDSKTGKRSKVFIEEVDKYILQKLIDGNTPFKLIQDLMDNWEFNTIENARKRIATVVNRMKIENKQEIDEKIALYKEQYFDLFTMAKNAGEAKTANGILDSLVKLEGLAATKIEAKVSSTSEINLTNVTDDKLESLVNKLLLNNKE